MPSWQIANRVLNLWMIGSRHEILVYDCRGSQKKFFRTKKSSSPPGAISRRRTELTRTKTKFSNFEKLDVCSSHRRREFAGLMSVRWWIVCYSWEAFQNFKPKIRELLSRVRNVWANRKIHKINRRINKSLLLRLIRHPKHSGEDKVLGLNFLILRVFLNFANRVCGQTWQF